MNEKPKAYRCPRTLDWIAGYNDSECGGQLSLLELVWVPQHLFAEAPVTIENRDGVVAKEADGGITRCSDRTVHGESEGDDSAESS